MSKRLSTPQHLLRRATRTTTTTTSAIPMASATYIQVGVPYCAGAMVVTGVVVSLTTVGAGAATGTRAKREMHIYAVIAPIKRLSSFCSGYLLGFGSGVP